MRTLLLFLLALPALAHQQPTTLARLDVGDSHVTLSLHVPLTELELAFGHDVSNRPEQSLPQWDADFHAYLTRHIHPRSPNGQPWSVAVRKTTVQQAERTPTGVFQ